VDSWAWPPCAEPGCVPPHATSDPAVSARTPHPQKPAWRRNTRPSRSSQTIPGSRGAQSQLAQPGGSARQACSRPSSGPQCELHARSVVQLPDPQSKTLSGSQAQPSSGPGTHTPPLHWIEAQHGLPQSWPSVEHRTPSGRSTGQAGASSGGHSTAGQSASVQSPPMQVNGPNAGESGVGQQEPQLAPSSTHGLPSSGWRPQ